MEAMRGNKVNALSAVQTRKQTIREVCNKTGFRIKDLIYHHYDKDQIRGRSVSGLVFTGDYEGKKAVLKLHGLEEESHDVEMMEKFAGQNESKIIRSPKLYKTEKWDKESGYGYMLMEYVDAPRICNSPFATNSQKRDFGRFYEEYKTRAITKPWIEKPKIVPTISNFAESVELWRSKAEALGRIVPDEYVQYISEFYAVVEKQASKIPIRFMHGHLYPEHILREKNGNYVILDHMSWMYRLEWADLSYMIWRLMLDIRDNSYSAEKFIRYAYGWIEHFRKIPVVREDAEFDKKIGFLLLERSVGSIVGDLGAGKYWGSREGRGYLRHRLLLQQKFFEYFYKALI